MVVADRWAIAKSGKIELGHEEWGNQLRVGHGNVLSNDERDSQGSAYIQGTQHEGEPDLTSPVPPCESVAVTPPLLGPHCQVLYWEREGHWEH